MHQPSSNESDEGAALTRHTSIESNLSGHHSSSSAPVHGAAQRAFDAMDTMCRRASTGSGRTGWNNQHHGNNHTMTNSPHEGFESILPPNPGQFHRNEGLGGPMAMNHHQPSHPANLGHTSNTMTMLHNPLGGTANMAVGTSQNTAHLDPNPERLINAGFNAQHAPYSNYESVMSSLGQMPNTLSYGQASRMQNNGYAEREREMYAQFDMNMGRGLGFDELEELPNENSQWNEEVAEREFENKPEVIDVDDDDGCDNNNIRPTQEMHASSPQTNRSTSGTSSRRSYRLQEWIELHKPPPPHSSDDATAPQLTAERKIYLERVTQLSHAILSKIVSGLERSKQEDLSTTGNDVDNGGNVEWEPRPSDIAVENIGLIEVTTISGDMKIEEVNFDVLSNFDWENSLLREDQHQGDLPLLSALRMLLYELYMEGKKYDADFMSSNVVSKERTGSDDGMMEMLHILMDGGDENEDNNEKLLARMRSIALPLPLCRFLTDLFMANETNCNITLRDVLSDLEQMIRLPYAFLYGMVTSRWELVFGKNYMFGRENELAQLMEAVSRLEQGDSQKEAILISGHAGIGKSRLVQEIRKTVKAKGFTFLRCKFEKTIHSEPLSVVALGLDEFFMSTMPCFPQSDSFQKIGDINQMECTCSNPQCPRKVIQQLYNRGGLESMKKLCLWMPSFKRLAIESYPMHVDYLDDGNAQHQWQVSEQDTHDLIRLLGIMLDVLASACPVAFFVDDLQWADVSTITLLTHMISMVCSNLHEPSSKSSSILFIGACRIDEGLTSEVVMNHLLHGLESCESISLGGLDVESLNAMMCEVLCLPRRKTRSLSEVIHMKTQGVPLFVVELVDKMLADELLTESDKFGWEWDINAIKEKPIANGVAELLVRQLEHLPSEVKRGLQILSCFEAHSGIKSINLQVIDIVKNSDPNCFSDLSMALNVGANNFLLFVTETNVAFSHDHIQRATYEAIPEADLTSMLLNLISCLVSKCRMGTEVTDALVLSTAGIMNKVGSSNMSINAHQRQLFAEYNLDSGRRLIEQANFSNASQYLRTGLSYIEDDRWAGNYYLTLGLVSNIAVANYSLGNVEDCFAYSNQVFEHATTFEDKFEAYCVYVKLLGAQSTDQAIEKLLYLLPFVGENIDPNAISQQLAVDEMIALQQALSGSQKNMILQLSTMTDSRSLMAMKLMGMLVLYSSQQKAFLSGYLANRMIRMSMQYGQCEDTVYAMSVFCSSLVYTINDVQEHYSLAHVTLSLMNNYNKNKLIPRVNGLIYGTVLSIRDPLRSTLKPLSDACHLGFQQGIHEHSILNTLIYVRKCVFGGQKLPTIIDELVTLAEQHKKINQIPVIRYFLAPAFRVLSVLSGMVTDNSKVFSEYKNEPNEDIVAAAIEHNELVYVRAVIGIVMFESVILRDFTKASELIIKYPQFFEVTVAMELDIFFMAGLVSLHMARSTRVTHWIEKSNKMLAAYENWLLSNPANYEHKYYLLKAEYEQLNGETDNAIEAYQVSIDSAHSNGFIHNEAIACEMAAHHYANIEDKKMTRYMIQKTHDVYSDWGANTKAKSVLELLNLQYLNDTV